MKQHQKWLNEALSDEVAEKFEAETQNDATMDEVINTISETAWRGALEWVWKTLEHLSPSDYELLEKELGDETSQESL